MERKVVVRRGTRTVEKPPDLVARGDVICDALGRPLRDRKRRREV